MRTPAIVTMSGKVLVPFAKCQLPGESKQRVLRAPVCRVLNGKWKLFSALTAPQIFENDTPEAFFERLKTALAASTRQQFDEEIMISKSEHREFCKIKKTYYSPVPKWDFWPTDPNLEKSLDDMHEFEWNRSLPRRQMSDNWLDGEQGIWANPTVSKVEMDTSDAVVPRKRFQQDEWPRSVEVAFFSAYFQFPGEVEAFRVIAPVCRILGGRWKLVEGLRVYR